MEMSFVLDRWENVTHAAAYLSRGGMTEKRCRECGTALPTAKGRGRPPEYCGATCRRLRGLAIRRTSRQLEGLESLLRWTRHGQWFGTPAGRALHIAQLKELIVDAKAELRLLLERE